VDEHRVARFEPAGIATLGSRTLNFLMERRNIKADSLAVVTHPARSGFESRATGQVNVTVTFQPYIREMPG